MGVAMAQWLFLLSPFLLIWGLLVWFTPFQKRTRVCISALTGGAIWAVAIYLDNVDAGNCCREDMHAHPHSLLSEIWAGFSAVIIFGCIGAFALIIVEVVKAKLQKP
jgi:hypothetical protein